MKFRRIDPIVVLSEVSKAVCDMISIRSLMDLGKSSTEIATTLKMNEYKVKLYLRAIGHRTAASLGETLEKCRRLDLAGKTGAADYSGLERLIAEESLRT